MISQLPIEHLHATVIELTFADAILDRLIHNATSSYSSVNRCGRSKTILTDRENLT